jgi:hypothetical protein
MAPQASGAIAYNRRSHAGSCDGSIDAVSPMQRQERLGRQVLGDLFAARDAHRTTEHCLHVLP